MEAALYNPVYTIYVQAVYLAQLATCFQQCCDA